MVVMASTLGWLGWRLPAQDDELGRQRLAEQRELAADRLVAALEQRLVSIEQNLDQLRDDLLPEVPADVEISREFLARAERLEFEEHDVDGAISLLRPQADASDPRIAAAALVRI
jgi:hypothetical protein